MTRAVEAARTPGVHNPRAPRAREAAQAREAALAREPRDLVVTATLVLALVVGLGVAMVAATGCTAELIPREGAGPDPVGEIDPEAQALFLDTVQPLLQADRPSGSCAFCHQGDQDGFGPVFLGETLDDNYDALRTGRLIAPDSPDTSRLVTRGAHSGDAFPDDERVIVESWIAVE